VAVDDPGVASAAALAAARTALNGRLCAGASLSDVLEDLVALAHSAAGRSSASRPYPAPSPPQS